MFDVVLPQINLWAVLVATLIHFGIGALWYSPLLFSKMWQDAIPKNERKSTLVEGIVTTIAGGLLAFLALAVIVGYTGSSSFLSGLKIGLLVWTLSLYVYVMNSAYQGTNRKLTFIDNGYTLITFAIAGGLLGFWK
jgi:Protein of unknown function (DUF1761)